MNRIWQTIAISQWRLKIQWNRIIGTHKFFHKGNWFERAKSWEFSSRWPTRKGLCLHVKFSRRFFKILKFNLICQNSNQSLLRFTFTWHVTEATILYSTWRPKTGSLSLLIQLFSIGTCDRGLNCTNGKVKFRAVLDFKNTMASSSFL